MGEVEVRTVKVGKQPSYCIMHRCHHSIYIYIDQTDSFTPANVVMTIGGILHSGLSFVIIYYTIHQNARLDAVKSTAEKLHTQMAVKTILHLLEDAGRRNNVPLVHLTRLEISARKNKGHSDIPG